MEEGVIALPQIYVDALTPGVRTLGPGTRIGLWVQGCTLGCRGCISPDLFVRRPDRAYPVEAVTDSILKLAPTHDGLTISGGEPFEQAGSLAASLRDIRRRSNLNILVYSGFSLKEIRKRDDDSLRMLAFIDILIDGRFRQDLPTNLVWRGSANQQMYLLTERAQAFRKYLKMEYERKRPVQIDLISGGRLRIIGIPHRDRDLSLSRAVERRGCRLIRGGK